MSPAERQGSSSFPSGGKASCAHPDVRYFADEKGAIACMECGRLFGHLVDGWMHPHNVITIDSSVFAEARRLYPKPRPSLPE